MSEAVSITEIFRFCPRCGNRATCLGDNPFVCDTCHFTHYFSPVAAVGAIITDPRQRVLVICRAKDPGLGKFGLPGGFVDPGESCENALRREVLEEIGLLIDNAVLLTTFPNRYCYAGTAIPVVDLFYLCRLDEDPSISLDKNEVISWQWCQCEPQVLKQMAFTSHRQALEVYMEKMGHRVYDR